MAKITIETNEGEELQFAVKGKRAEPRQAIHAVPKPRRLDTDPASVALRAATRQIATAADFAAGDDYDSRFDLLAAEIDSGFDKAVAALTGQIGKVRKNIGDALTAAAVKSGKDAPVLERTILQTMN